MPSSSATPAQVVASPLSVSLVNAPRARRLIWFTVLFVAGCGGAEVVPCRASSACAAAQVCVPSPAGASYCAALDADCSSGLRWAPSAGGGLADQCITLAGDDGVHPVADGGLPPPASGPCASQADGVVCAGTDNPCKKSGICLAGVCQAIADAANGTACGSAADACHAAPACQSGVCQPAASLAEGTACGAPVDACHAAPACKSGVCQPGATLADGPTCGGADGAGWTASKATYGSGAFVRLNQLVWIENNAEGHHAYSEVGRDQWSVYLKATDRAGVDVQLDFWTHQVKQTGPGNPTPTVLHTLTTEDRVSGWAASRVTYENGAYVQLDATTWVENNGDGLHTFTEVGRDEWSVYLNATDRAGISVQLDLWTLKIFYQAPGTGRIVLHPIGAAEPPRLDGWSAREVLYASGRFTQTGVSSWSELNGDGTHAFRETGRDQWSVYLTATDRANVLVQLDLWTLQVKDPNGVVRYGITGAR